MADKQLWIKCSCGVCDVWFGTREEAETKIASELLDMSKVSDPPIDMSKHVMQVVETESGANKA